MKPVSNSNAMFAAPHADRWHYLDYRDGKHDREYLEWKYFNFIQKDTAGYLIYYVFDPEHKFSFSGGRVTARIMHGGRFYGGIEKVPIGKIEFDTHGAGVQMGNASISEKTPYRYLVEGNAAGVSWELEYVQHVPTIESFQKESIGIFSWEKFNWLVKMPRAGITGTINIGGVVIPVAATGYSDTNWGEELPLFSRYEWGQFNDEKISLVFGAVYKWGVLWRAYVYAIFGGKIIVFNSDTFRFLDRVSGTDKKIGLKVPQKTECEAVSGPYKLRWLFAPVQNDLLTLRIASFLPKPSVVEQISLYEGVLERDGAVLYRFNGSGFSEYSSRTWFTRPAVEF
ncbi:MAG: hypothetical protein HYW90_04970 [Candidatus Sungbacteria bacterium]|nr:hypothetical protein [Candidatus Sungbacteria bacterium]